MNGTIHDSKVYRTDVGTAYLREPGVALLAHTKTNLINASGFLRGFGSESDFLDYLDDDVKLPDGEALVKFAGQMCYMSLGPDRTRNYNAPKYFDNIKAQGHGSVLEHVSYTFLIYGVDRSFTHELVRHRAGAAYSQTSQRYVQAETLRFVERIDHQSDPLLHAAFEAWIDKAAAEYNMRAQLLMELQAGGLEVLSGEKKRDLRKKVNQAARACLPNETEAPIVVTLNARSLRHVIEMRANAAADLPIRQVGVILLQIARAVSPMLFSDYEIINLADGTQAVNTVWRKV